MKPIYKSLALAAMTLQVSLALNAETRDDESASTMALQAELLDSLRVELVAQNVSGARNLIESGECVIDGSNLTITLDTSEWTHGAMYRVQVLATFGTQTQVIYALNVTVPYYIALSDTPQEYEDTVTVVSTITDVTEADLEGFALEKTSQEIKAAITPISQAADAYNVGKTQLAAAITSKGVETSPTESYPEMAEKVNAISQETYEINGGEMYAKQLFGSLTTPNYWNLYEVLTQLLSDGRLVNYGGILLAEYNRGYDSIALAGAGAGGAYVVSDKDSDGNFIMYTNDTTHVWDTAFDGEGNRWVAYCFADEWHDFDITDTNTSPRSIFIGRKVGKITSLVNSRCSQIVVTDGNKLGRFASGGFAHNFGRYIVINNLETIGVGDFSIQGATELVDITVDNIRLNTSGKAIALNGDTSLILTAKEEFTVEYPARFIESDNRKHGLICFAAPKITGILFSNYNTASTIDTLAFITEEIVYSDGGNFMGGNWNINRVYFGYINNDKTKTVKLAKNSGGNISGTMDVQLQNGWCKPALLNKFIALTKENVQAHIFDRLGVNDISTGAVAITLANAVLNLFTQEEIDAVVERTNITIVGA